jgi:hypothetical protein
MKHIYTLIIVLFVLVASAQAQVTIYSENFSAVQAGAAVGDLPTGYTATTGNWSRSNLNALTPTTQISGGFYLRGQRAGNGNNVTNLQRVDLKGIRVKGYSSVKIKWADIKTATHSSSLTSNTELYYSIDGGNYQRVAINAQGAVNGGWKVVNNGQFISIPNIPATATFINFYWTVSMTRSDDYFGIDDIILVGDQPSMNDVFSWANRPYNEDPFIASSPAAQNPYNVDYTPMRWTYTMTGGTDLGTRVVRNERFQSPNKSLTLVQTGANATQGSSINISFEDNMADLTFTLFDVDQHTGQFQDLIVITAFNSAGKQVLLKDENVQRTNKVNFNAATTTLTGISGQDIVGSSTEGDVTVKFAEPVKQVIISYYNADQTRGSQGTQGIGIYNISGHVAGNITPLPVELVSFKGQANADGVNLTWRTASEQDNKGFEVQVSTDGRTFKKVGFVDSKVGTTSLMQNYSFRDSRATSGTNYYRLKQIDFDGTFEYSKTIAVNLTLASSSAVFPTLATSDITVRLTRTDEQVTILVADMAGKQLASVQNPSDRQVVMPVQHLQTGVYFVTVITGEQKEVFRFVKR